MEYKYIFKLIQQNQLKWKMDKTNKIDLNPNFINNL